MLAATSRAVRRRPLMSLGIASTTAVVTYASWSEYRASSTTATALPRAYNGQALVDYWGARPLSTAYRLSEITYQLGPLLAAYARDFIILPSVQASSNRRNDPALQRHHARRLRQALTALGPAFVKAGQQMSIRPDLVPPAVLLELQSLCDAVAPIDDAIALQVLRDELQLTTLEDSFADLHRVAAASIGQVYQARLLSNGHLVAIKIQRPLMRESFSLDLYLLQRFGKMVDLFTTSFTQQPPFHGALYESFAAGSYAELDYEQEAQNQRRFAEELRVRQCPVIIPRVYEDYSTEKVLTSEWIEGIKLADSSPERIRELIPVGVELFLTQLLDIGAFHADPHPGNLLVTPEGKLCLIDFGLCTEVDEKSRQALTKAIYHLLMRDFDALVQQDAIALGFLPADFDTSRLQPLLTTILTVAAEGGSSDLRHRQKKLGEISSELNQVFFQYPFSVPPFFALVTRGLALLEGIALTGDPSFDIFQASAPYATKRAVAMLGAPTRSWWWTSRRPV
jgi:aarF domain-containing kinase